MPFCFDINQTSQGAIMLCKLKSRMARLTAAFLVIAVAGGIGLTAVDAAAQTTELKAAFFASTKHPIWAKLMVPWGKAI